MLSFIISLQTCSLHVRKLKIPFLKPFLAEQANFPFSGVLTCFMFFKNQQKEIGFHFFYLYNCIDAFSCENAQLNGNISKSLFTEAGSDFLLFSILKSKTVHG